MIPLGRLNSEEASLPYPDVSNTVFSSPPPLCYTYFSSYTLPWGQGLTIFGLAVLVIHEYLSKMISQPPSLELALWPEDPALDPALSSHVRDLTFCKNSGEFNEAHNDLLSHEVHVAIKQGCVESTVRSCRRPPLSHPINT